MNSAPIIRDASPGDLETLVTALSDSFSEDPMFNWVFPQRWLYPVFFRMLVRDVYLPRGIVHIEQEGRAAALWLPPQERFKSAPRRELLTFCLKLIGEDGLRPLWRVLQQGSVFGKHQPREPHYYLQFIGCRHASQGQGIGAALLKQGLSICDERGMPAYLECSNIRNIQLYERHGFAVRAQQAVGKRGPTAWFMWRDSR
jgi:GNAT superfamily N-acetyltransferase